MIAVWLAGLLLADPSVPTANAAVQDPVAQQAPAQPDVAVELEDVVVTGRSLDTMIRNFVGEVAEPNRGRGLARWDGEICVGVSNLQADAAQYLADRVSTVAEDLGLQPGAPGCAPNILVIATDDAEGIARTLVSERRRAFRMGGAGMDRGGSALEDFVETDRPVRWWQMAVPVDAETGARATRLAGDCNGIKCGGGGGQTVLAFAPSTNVFAASRLRTQFVDNLIRAVVIVDVDQVRDVSILQLADYIAMVSLAQIDPDADTRGYASILNVFNDPDGSASLTNWDQAFLGGLYAAERNAAAQIARRSEIVDAIHDAHGRLREGENGEEPGVED
ncbi:hypothetical protein [Brevundimonas sp. AAP58]|uniref:hypothetical protein n=1 Tax=Brevundimonas sp. AAP58 TaxID=1523422 RepID=UPI0006B88EEA|nr:hypothetical protein [Brevundimonas sp. AAP58]